MIVHMTFVNESEGVRFDKISGFTLLWTHSNIVYQAAVGCMSTINTRLCDQRCTVYNVLLLTL